jgi:hypothetical protein
MTDIRSDASIQLDAVCEQLGINGNRLRDSILLADMQLACIQCGTHERCVDWLRTGQQDGYQAFCPNAELLDWLCRSRSSVFAATWR